MLASALQELTAALSLVLTSSPSPNWFLLSSSSLSRPFPSLPLFCSPANCMTLIVKLISFNLSPMSGSLRLHSIASCCTTRGHPGRSSLIHTNLMYRHWRLVHPPRSISTRRTTKRPIWHFHWSFPPHLAPTFIKRRKPQYRPVRLPKPSHSPSRHTWRIRIYKISSFSWTVYEKTSTFWSVG